MASFTRSRIAGLTPYALRMTFETAARETPAARATSSMVAAPTPSVSAIFSGLPETLGHDEHRSPTTNAARKSFLTNWTIPIVDRSTTVHNQTYRKNVDSSTLISVVSGSYGTAQCWFHNGSRVIPTPSIKKGNLNVETRPKQ